MPEADQGRRLADPRVLVLGGPTASGKTALAAALAEAVGGAVVSADSRQVFRGLEIGSAQPDARLRARVPHFLVGFLSPAAAYSAGAYGLDARRVLAALSRRGVPTIVCGGTGLYLRALLEGCPGPLSRVPAPGERPSIRARRREEISSRWRAVGGESLHAELARVDPPLAATLHPHDRQRVIRGLEFHAEHGVALSRARRVRAPQTIRGPGPLRYRLDLPLRELEERIALRLQASLRAGWLEEARRLLERFGEAPPRALEALGYAELFEVLRGESTLPEGLERVRLRTRRYAKRQRTWFRNQDDYVPLPVGAAAFDHALRAWRERLA